MPRRLSYALLPLLLASATGLTACGSSDKGASDKPDVAVAFYPLEFLAQRLGGDAITIDDLTAPGAEPHDLELKPKQVARLSEADLVVYIKGFQPAVDDAVEQEARDSALDVGSVTPRETGYVPIEEGEAKTDEAGEDPHVWLDPLRFAAISDAVAERLAKADPDQAATFRANAATLRAELTDLDAAYRNGLKTCERREIVTSHNAYGYLARTYGLEQVSLTGLTPEDEASPATLARVARFAQEEKVTTIFFEELVSPKVAEALASEVGAKAVDLSPLEGKPDDGDYLTQMRANLVTLQTALGCTAL